MKKSKTEAIYGDIRDSENAKEYLDAVTRKLKALDIPIANPFLIHLVLNSLPSPYGYLKVIYNAQKDKWDLNELISVCVQEEARIKKENEANIVHLTTNSPKRHHFKPSSHTFANKDNSKANPPPKSTHETIPMMNEVIPKVGQMIPKVNTFLDNVNGIIDALLTNMQVYVELGLVGTDGLVIFLYYFNRIKDNKTDKKEKASKDVKAIKD
ncbi:unnamed protein product [Prunus brigantina]